jgi:hypothetical protein
MQSHPKNHLFHPALASFADECSATLARLLAYVGTLALFVIVGVHSWDQLQFDTSANLVGQRGFTPASHSRPAFAVSALDPFEKSESYEISRHPAGGRKDTFHWGAAGEEPVVELEIYRPGGEFDPSEPADADLAGRMAADAPLEAAGVIGSKFGTIALFRRSGQIDAAKSCLGFIRRFDDPALQISGWSCQGASLPARRAAIACMLDRLTLLASGNEPRFAELFARAELKRRGCGTATAVSADWVAGAENPRLRGPL